MNALMKDIIRDMKNSKGRFIAIAAIIALGALLFTGVKIAPVDMKYNADKYYDDYNLMDIRIMSTLGLTEDDLKDISTIEGVKEAAGSYYKDVLIKIEGDESVIRVHSIGTINDVKVIDGRMPENDNECVIGSQKFKNLGISIGDNISLISGDGESLSDTLNNDQYTVVGVVESPFYLTGQIGSTDIGSGTVNQYMYIPESNFKSDIYPEIYVTVEGAKALNSYETEYFDVVDKVKEKLEDKEPEIAERRYEQVKGEALSTIDEKRQEYEKSKQEVIDQLNEAEKSLDDGSNQIASAEAELDLKESQYYSGLSEGKAKLQQAEDQLKAGQEEYYTNLSKFNEKKAEAESGFAEAEKSIALGEAQLQELRNQRDGIKAQLSGGNVSALEKPVLEMKLKNLESGIEQGESQLEAAKQQLADGRQELENSEKQLKDAAAGIENGWLQLADNNAAYLKSADEGKKLLDNARSTLEEKKAELESGRQKYEENKASAMEQLKDGEEKLNSAEDEIENIKKPSMYFLNRKSHYSYVDYENSADSINKLSNVFPLFFFVVAALVCSTTMTRMVDEERINIGTLKALGYGKFSIMKKFVIYGFMASVLGSLIGLIGGFTFLPAVIYNAYRIMYALPDMHYRFSPLLAVAVSFAFIAVTTVSTLGACRHDLKETPAVLMVPKSPKSGKRILLERIPFIWNRFGFIQKVTLRNIFRYKKRFFMTVIGIAGSTALLLTGFGIKDSINTVVDKQFQDINKYQLSFTMEKNISDENLEALNEYLVSDDNVGDYIFVNSTTGEVTSGDKNKEVSLIVTDDNVRINDFIAFRNRKTGDNINLDNEGVIVSEKTCKMLNVSAGDEIELKNADNITKTVKIQGITENYINHYVYMSKEYYTSIFGESVDDNSGFIVVDSQENEEKSSKQVSASLTDMEGISGVVNNSGVKDTFGETIKSMNFVILVMIVCAGALSFTVLYNLTNLNISERIREIATIKVLGFYNNEVSMYIFRENILLTIIGVFSGLFLGVALHRFIIVTVEMDYVMFGRNVKLFSFAIAAVLTGCFSAIVNFAMYFKLKKVKMVESLKSVE